MCGKISVTSQICYFLSIRFEVKLKAGLIWLEIFSPKISYRRRKVRWRRWKAVPGMLCAEIIHQYLHPWFQDIRKAFSESTLHQWSSCPEARLVC